LAEEAVNLLAVGIVVGAFDQEVILIFNFWATMAATGVRFVVDSMGERI
jgi:putative flippase GtrA